MKKMKQSTAVDMQQLVNIAKSMNMRVGQLIVNAFAAQASMDTPQSDLFYAADDKIIVACRQYAARSGCKS